MLEKKQMGKQKWRDYAQRNEAVQAQVQQTYDDTTIARAVRELFIDRHQVMDADASNSLIYKRSHTPAQR